MNSHESPRDLGMWNPTVTQIYYKCISLSNNRCTLLLIFSILLLPCVCIIEKIVPGTLQENGASERMNMTIMERARCMRLHVGLPLQFWEDVVDIFVYLINRGPSSSFDGGIPEEAWTSKKVNYSFLNTFGCEAFVHINKKVEQSLSQNQRNVPLLDMKLRILVIAFMIMKNTKSLGADMSYSMKRFCIRIRCRKRNRENKTEYIVLDEITEKV